jgi:hypothetical protein
MIVFAFLTQPLSHVAQKGIPGGEQAIVDTEADTRAHKGDEFFILNGFDQLLGYVGCHRLLSTAIQENNPGFLERRNTGYTMAPAP